MILANLHQLFITQHSSISETRSVAMSFRIKITGHSTNFEPPTGTPTCSVCGKSGSSTCGRCKANTYCSTSCQTQDWEYHRLVCSNYSVVTDDERPGRTYFRALCKCRSFYFEPGEGGRGAGRWETQPATARDISCRKAQGFGRKPTRTHEYLHTSRQGSRRTRPSPFGSGWIRQSWILKETVYSTRQSGAAWRLHSFRLLLGRSSTSTSRKTVYHTA